MLTVVSVAAFDYQMPDEESQNEAPDTPSQKALKKIFQKDWEG